MKYEPTWQSLDSRPTPQWFNEGKIGIFIHWGIYSVPAWGPKRHLVNTPGKAYAEWYWAAITVNGEQDHGQLYHKYHRETYGENFLYQDFAPMFKAELFDPDDWADVIARSGARYVVPTTKHHDGFCLWPSDKSPYWNSVDIGPHRDLIADIAKSVRDKGLRFGLYYSLMEWFHPLIRIDVPQEQWRTEEYIETHMIPQMKDIVERYEPSMFFSDGQWALSTDEFQSKEFLAWLYNESPVKDEIAVNDRWGYDMEGDKLVDTMGRHGGFYTTEYDEIWVPGSETETFEFDESHPWNENRGVGSSFGYNRNEAVSDYLSEKELIYLLVEKVSRGGGLLLNIGPTADGRIPVIQQERLLQMGDWLGINGQAIYGSRAWKKRAEESGKVRYTCTNDTVYAIALGWPGKKLVLEIDEPSAGVEVSMLAIDKKLPWRYEDGKMHIDVSDITADLLPCNYAYSFRIRGLA